MVGRAATKVNAETLELTDVETRAFIAGQLKGFAAFARRAKA
jgi:hypothetical protein